MHENKRHGVETLLAAVFKVQVDFLTAQPAAEVPGRVGEQEDGLSSSGDQKPSARVDTERLPSRSVHSERGREGEDGSMHGKDLIVAQSEGS